MKPPKQHLSRFICSLAAIAAFFITSSLAVQAADQLKPGAEEKAFEICVGEWDYQGEGPDTPFYPGGKFKGKETARIILNGFFLELDWSDTGDSGHISSGKGIFSYDRAAKTYRDIGFENDGTISHGTTTVSKDGKVWTSVGKRNDSKGKTYDVRFISTFSADGKTRTGKGEYSSDGKKTWKLMFDLQAKKVK